MSTPLNASLLRGFSILSLFSDQRNEISVAVVCSELNLNAATAHRFLTTLEEVGVIFSHARGKYSLGLRMSEYGALAQRTSPLVSTVQPVIDRLAMELDEAVMVARAASSGVMCVATAQANRAIAVNVKIGTILDYHATAQGKLWLAHMHAEQRDRKIKQISLKPFNPDTIIDTNNLLAELERVKQQGYATNLGEREPDIAAVAVPVVSKKGELILTLSVFGMRHRFAPDFIDHVRKKLEQAARIIRASYYT
ncbi:MAG: IclR family transcriptional regulator [Rhodospirillales bacterium]|nr:IclR family transcriptional regulator [Rhodospirillales bacterium]